VILTILVSGQATYLEKQLSADRFAAFISLFENLVLLENFVQQEQMTKANVKHIRKYIPLLKDFFKETINRKEGKGCKFITFHLLDHLADDLLRNGSCANSNSGPCESRHKVHCKQPADHTQRIVSCFEEQVGRQYADNIIVDLTHQETNVTNEKILSSEKLDASRNLSFHSKRYFFQDGMLYDTTSRHGAGLFKQFTQWRDKQLENEVIKFI